MADLFRGLRKLASGAIVLNPDPAAAASAAAAGAGDGFTRGLSRDSDNALLVAMAKETQQATVPAAAATTDPDQVVAVAPFTATVTKVAIVPEAAVTADATNYRTFTLINKGQAGAGTTVVATLALDTPTTDDLAAFDEKSLVLSVVTGATNVAKGDVLVLAETHAGTGLAHSGGRVLVDFKLREA